MSQLSLMIQQYVVSLSVYRATVRLMELLGYELQLNLNVPSQ